MVWKQTLKIEKINSSEVMQNLEMTHYMNRPHNFVT